MIRHVIDEKIVPLDNDIQRALTTFFYDNHSIEINDQTNYEKVFNASTYNISRFKRRRKNSKFPAYSVIRFFRELENILIY